MTTAKAGGPPAKVLAPAQLDVAQSPVAADLTVTVLDGLIARHMGSPEASGFGALHDTARRSLTRLVGQIRLMHPDDQPGGE